MRGGLPLPPVVKHYYVQVINKEKYMNDVKEGKYYSPADLSREFSLPEGHFLLNSANHSLSDKWVRIISIKLESEDKTLTETDRSLIGQIGVVYPLDDMKLPNGTNIEYILAGNEALIKRKITEGSNYNILHYTW